MPKGARTRILTNQKPLEYDSTKVYMHMGTALKASETAQIGMLRLAQTLSETIEAKELQEAALLERLQNILNDIDEFERFLVKFEVGETQKIAKLTGAALENTRSALGWFQKFLESHSDEDAKKYAPLADRLKLVVAQLVDVRKEKIENALHMEEAYKTKRSSLQKRSNLIHPVTQVTRSTISGGEDQLPTVPVDPQELMDNARLQIIQKELDSKSKQIRTRDLEPGE